MWETRHSIADWVCSKTQTLLATLRTRNQPQEVYCVLLEVEQSFQSVGCARSKLLSRTVPQSLRSFLCMLDCVWMGYLLLIFRGILNEVLHSTNNNVQPKHNGIQETGAPLHSKTKRPNVKKGERCGLCTHKQILLKVSLRCTFLKTRKP